MLAVGQLLVWAALFYIFPAMWVRWEAAFGWTRAELTLAITFAILASGVAAPVAGRIIDAGYGALMMSLAAAMGGVGLIALAEVTALWQFYGLWLWIGVMMAGCLYEACFALLTRARGGQARQAIVWITLVAGFAGTLSFPTVHVLSEAFGWQMAVRLIGAVVIAVVTPMLWIGGRGLQDVPSGAQTGAAEISDKGFLRTPVFWCIGLGFAAIAVVHGATLQHLLPILAERGLSVEFAVTIAAMIGPMQVAGRVAMVVGERWMSNLQFAVLAFALMGLSLVILQFLAIQRAGALAFVILFGSAYGTISILRPLIARELLGERQFGAKSGALAWLYMTGAAVSAYFGALVWSVGGYGLMLILLIGLAGVASALCVAAYRPRDLASGKS